MSSPYDQHIEELLGAYRRERAQIGELQRTMREVKASATAPRQALKVTVNSQGEVTEIEFPTGAYKRMAPVELSQMLLTTIQKARTTAMAEVAEVLAGHLPAGWPPPTCSGARPIWAGCCRRCRPWRTRSGSTSPTAVPAEVPVPVSRGLRSPEEPKTLSSLSSFPAELM